MAQIINTNIASLNAQRNLNSAQAGNDTALQRLSSGLRINSAADDAAGLSISTRFDAQINGSNQAIRNSADGVSLAQTAEGALDSITDSLQRIRELAVQSANGTNNSIDREALNLEAQQLIDEIENVSGTANFNGTSLLDGSFSGITFQTGANVGNSIEVSINEVSTSTLGVSETAGASAAGGLVGTDTSANALANGDLVLNGVAIVASSAADDTASTANADQSAIAKAAAINKASDQTGVTAVALSTEISGVDAGTATVAQANLQINGVNIDLAANTDVNIGLESNVAAINAKSGLTGVTASYDGDPAKGITLTAEDGRNITIGNNGTPANTGIAANGTYTGAILMQSKDGSDIEIGEGTGTLANSGFTAGTKSGSAASLSSFTRSEANYEGVAAPTIATGDLTINDISIRATRATDDDTSFALAGDAEAESWVANSAIAKAAAINEVSDQTGVTAVVETNVVAAGTQAGGGATAGVSANFDLNGVTIEVDLSIADGDDRRIAAVDAINGSTGQTGITAVDTGDGIELRAEDGRNIVAEFANAADAASIGVGFGTAITAQVQTGSIRLEAAGEFELGSITGSIDNFDLKVGTYGAEEAGTFLKDVDISTVDGALAAIGAVDNALQQVSTERANLGATQNRFNSTINNLTISSENLSASNSRIRDADYAAETAELSRTQVLIQAGISVLAQANARPQQVLSLLG